MLDGTARGWNIVYLGTHASVSPVTSSVSLTREMSFLPRVLTPIGKQHWGLQKHATSQCHVQAMATWSELKCREASGETIDCMLVGKTQLEKNRYYVKIIGGVVKFLSINEQGLRGTTETPSNNDTSAGLFLNLFEYTLEKDAFLADIVKGIPKHAKYTSKDIHNEVIETLADMVLSEIKHRYANADSAGFCLKSDRA